MTTKTKRTDPHRPGAIVPAEYTYLLSYSLPAVMGSCVIPAINTDLALAKCAAAREAGASVFGGLGKCGVCGAVYVYGDLWRHEPTGDAVHLGHDCADKYRLLSDRSAWELANDRARDAAAVAILKAQNAEQRVAFLAKYEGLEADLAADHPIVRDIAERFAQYRTLSDKQVALVRKIAAELRAPKPEPETHVSAPTGRATFRGTVVSAKVVDSDYGAQVKVTIKVQAEGGSWLAWGTCPRQLLDDVAVRPDSTSVKALRGCEVEVTATLKPGRESHFALMGRPLGKILSDPNAAAIAEEKRVRDMVVSITTFLLAAAYEARS